jgi:hypothetical protein
VGQHGGDLAVIGEGKERLLRVPPHFEFVRPLTPVKRFAMMAALLSGKHESGKCQKVRKARSVRPT